MNKIETLIALVIIMLMVAAAVAITADIRNPDPYTLGDINADGQIDNMDLQLCRGYILKHFTLSGSEFIRADMNGDGKVNSSDFMIIKRHVLGIE